MANTFTKPTPPGKLWVLFLHDRTYKVCDTPAECDNAIRYELVEHDFEPTVFEYSNPVCVIDGEARAVVPFVSERSRFRRRS